MQEVSFLSLVPHLKALALSFFDKTNSISQGAHAGFRKGYEEQLIEYRHYVPGDDLRYLDWRLYSRTDKYYIREGYQRSKQRVFIWLDTSMSMRFDQNKFNVTWLLALGLAFLYRAQNDTVLFFLERGQHNKPEVIEIKGAHDFIRLNDFFLNTNIPRSDKMLPVDEALNQARIRLKSSNKVFWLTDMYVPIDDFKQVLDQSMQHRYNLAVLHLVGQQEWASSKKKKGFFSKLVDSETGDWLSSTHLQNYDTVWEEAVDLRARLLLARGCRYLRGQVEEGPLRILAGLGGL